MKSRGARLIVTADDVGLHRSTTDAAIVGYREGIVTACSVVASGEHFADAVDKLRELPSLDCGIHLALVDERPLAAPAKVQSLLSGERMHRSFGTFVARYVSGVIRMDEVERELRAQCELLLRSGLRVVHANGHQHLHVLPRVFEIVLRLAAEYGIRYVRIPRDEGGRSTIARTTALRVLRYFASRAARQSSGAITTNDRTIGISEAGHLSAERIIRLLEHVAGVTELVTHPGSNDGELARVYGWNYAWEAESRALCDPSVRAAIRSRGIELTSVSALCDP